MYSSQSKCIGLIQKSPSVLSCPTAQTVKEFLFGGTRLKNLLLKFGLTGKWKMLSKSRSFSQLPARNQLEIVSCSQSCVRQRAAGAREETRLGSRAEPGSFHRRQRPSSPGNRGVAQNQLLPSLPPQLVCHCPQTQKHRNKHLSTEKLHLHVFRKMSREKG